MKNKFTVKLVILLLFVCFSTIVSAQSGRFPLTGQYSRGYVNKVVKWDNSWVDYPAYNNRQAWENLPEEAKKSIVKRGEAYLNFTWPDLKATDYLLFTRTGERATVDDMNKQRDGALNALLMAELVEGKGRFMDDLVNGVFKLCETTYWGSSAHFYLYGYVGGLDNPTTNLPDLQNPVIDIMGSDAASTLAWIYYFMRVEFDKISPVISKRMKYELETKFLQPYYQRNDFWWMYGRGGEGNVNNWNLWCNLNMLKIILLVEDDLQKKQDGFYKNLSSVDVFINGYPSDGSCSEGPSYWGAAVGRLFNYLDLVSKISDGKIDIFNNEKVREMGRYIYRTYISNGMYYTNYSDAPAKLDQGAERIYRIGQLIDDPVMKSFGAFLNTKNTGDADGKDRRGRASIENLFNPVDWKDTKPIEPLLAEYFFPDWDVAIARDKQGTTNGFYFCAKGGSNGEQHNHNDVGSFMLYYNGYPVFIDVGVGNYTRETFGKQRYSIWTMQSNYHNLPVINGLGQVNGGEHKAVQSKFNASAGKVSFSANLSKAYPDDAKVKSWIRSYTLERGKRFVIKDIYQLSENRGGSTVNFMTTIPVKIVSPGLIEIKGDGFMLNMKYDPSKLSAKIENIDVTDTKLQRGIGNSVSRLVFEVVGNQLSGNIGFDVVVVR
jgi:hypothetical protein